MTAIVETHSPSGLFRDGTPVTDWPSIRLWVLDRDGRLCQMCLIRTATDADHIWPRRLGGSDHISNLRAACGPCNKAKGDRVDVSTASHEDLHFSVLALDARIKALQIEREMFHSALLIRALAEPEKAARHAIAQRVIATAARDAAEYDLERWNLVEVSIGRNSKPDPDDDPPTARIAWEADGHTTTEIDLAEAV